MSRTYPEPEPLTLSWAPLRRRRRLLGVSQVELSAACGRARNACHYWENGTRMPTAEDWARMSRYLGTPSWQLADVIEANPQR